MAKPLPPCLIAALEYLRRGWSVLPLCPPEHQGVTGQHEQDCRRPGKQPICDWKAYQERLPRESELKLWWNRNPHCNVGVVLGKVSRLVGLDIDGPEAEEMLRELASGLPAPTLGFRTPGGGRRLFYQLAEGVIVP